MDNIYNYSYLYRILDDIHVVTYARIYSHVREDVALAVAKLERAVLVRIEEAEPLYRRHRITSRRNPHDADGNAPHSARQRVLPITQLLRHLSYRVRSVEAHVQPAEQIARRCA